jgi:hypothetical protein
MRVSLNLVADSYSHKEPCSAGVKSRILTYARRGIIRWSGADLRWNLELPARRSASREQLAARCGSSIVGDNLRPEFQAGPGKEECNFS